nr:hypothetical protein [Tanacetum cinerariifolium]
PCHPHPTFVSSEFLDLVIVRTVLRNAEHAAIVPGIVTMWTELSVRVTGQASRTPSARHGNRTLRTRRREMGALQRASGHGGATAPSTLRGSTGGDENHQKLQRSRTGALCDSHDAGAG